MFRLSYGFLIYFTSPHGLWSTQTNLMSRNSAGAINHRMSWRETSDGEPWTPKHPTTSPLMTSVHTKRTNARINTRAHTLLFFKISVYVNRMLTETQITCVCVRTHKEMKWCVISHYFTVRWHNYFTSFKSHLFILKDTIINAKPLLVY